MIADLAQGGRKRRVLRAAAIVSALALALAACSGAETPGTPTPTSTGGGTLRLGNPVALSNSDPIRAISSRDQSYLWNVYDTLLNFKPDTIEPTPGLAESWTQPDPLTLVLKLRTGVTFHDGTAFNADAVKFNLERARATGTTTAGLLASVASVDVTDPQTVTLHLKVANSALLLALSDLPGMMVSPTAAQKSANELSTTPVGAGPYQFVSQVSKSNFIVKRYANYWNKAYVGPDQIELTTLADPATQANALKSGQIDFALNVDASQVDSLKATSGIQVQTSPSFESIVILMNLQKPPLNNPMVRKAISMAVDRNALTDKGEFGFATPAWSILPKESWAYPKSLQPVNRDVAGAKALLTQAGFPNGISFDMIFHPTAIYQRLASLLKDQMAEAGINLDIISHDLTTGAPEFLSGAQFMSELASFGGRQDPGTAYSALYSSTAVLNPGKTVIPGMDAAIAKANSSAVVAERLPNLQALGELAANQTLSVVLYQRQLICAFTKSVLGYSPNVLGKPKFEGIGVTSS